MATRAKPQTKQTPAPLNRPSLRCEGRMTTPDGRCEYGKRGPSPCKRKAVARWNAMVKPPGGRRRKLLKGAGIVVCRHCGEFLMSQLDILALCLAARDGAKLARRIWGAP